MLADGSRVILGPDSRLTVPADFGSTARAVELKGDGYFDVRHDAAKPFTVRVANALVEDVGTTFTVESDAGDTTSVSVLSGSVRLRANGTRRFGWRDFGRGRSRIAHRRRSGSCLPEDSPKRRHDLDHRSRRVPRCIDGANFGRDSPVVRSRAAGCRLVAAQSARDDDVRRQRLDRSGS